MLFSYCDLMIFNRAKRDDDEVPCETQESQLTR